jgi:Flp pilus assembly protein TadD
LTLAALGGVCGNGFIDDFDDDEYVSQNPAVQAGLTWSGMRWALTAFHSHNWHPLTWLSLQLDTTLWGNAPRTYHRTNLLLHMANVLLLFAALWLMTGALWRSAAVAALFAVHPLHVESVAWIAERKDVLSAFFFLLTVWAYAYYARRPAWGRYLLVMLSLALGLSAKPMLVTLPGVLLLLDYWPLGRLWPTGEAVSAYAPSSPGRLVLEKLPLLILSVACSAATLAAQEHIVQTREDFPLGSRAANALVAYATYLVQAVWPVRLAFFYPHPPEGGTIWQIAGAALLLVGVSALVAWGARRHRYLPVGWLWYLGMLVPVIGLVQVGLQAHADRYTYLPLIGVFLMLGWGVPDLLPRWQVWAAVTAIVVGACAVVSWLQVGYWKDSPTLWQHTLHVTSDNYLAHHKLGMHLLRNDAAAAREQFEAAVRIQPRVAATHFGLAKACERLGYTDAAVRSFGEALRLNPALTAAHRELAGVYARLGDWKEAAGHYRAFLQIRPEDLGVRLDLSRVLGRQGKPEEAAVDCELARRQLEKYGATAATSARWRADYAGVVHELGVLQARQGRSDLALRWLHQAVELMPATVRYHCSLAHVLHGQGQTADAAEEYRKASELAPRWPEAANQAARGMATHPDAALRDGATAIELAQQACEATTPPRPDFYDTLAAAYAEAGNFPKAIAVAQQALAHTATDRPELVAPIRERLRLYQAGKPWRAPSPPAR